MRGRRGGRLALESREGCLQGEQGRIVYSCLLPFIQFGHLLSSPPVGKREEQLEINRYNNVHTRMIQSYTQRKEQEYRQGEY